jgi:YggT family protein
LAQLAELDPATAATASSVLAPLLNVGELLFIVRIVMTWYPNIKDDAFPWSLVYAPTEPLLSPTRKLITPVGRAALKNATPGDDD